MDYTLYVAEKPSAGEVFALYLSRKTGQPAQKMRDHYVIGKDIVVGWLRGHLVENVPPEAYDPTLKDWAGSAHLLPFIPNKFELAVKENVKGLFSTIKTLALKAREIVNCADPDDQGELLSMQFLHFIGITRPVKRLMAVDLSDKGLDRAFANIKSSKEFEGNFYSALAQSHADWLYGINMTRSCTLEVRKKGVNLLLNVGRVKTPLWAMIVKRELAIRNFVPKDFYKPWVQMQAKPGFRANWIHDPEDQRLDSEKRLADPAAAEAIVKSAKSARQGTVIKAETKPGQEAAPLPWALNTLQTYCARRYHWSPARTLEIAQKLYDKKLVSYPRTPIEHLPEDQHGLAPAILMSLATAPLPTAFAGALRGAKSDIKSKAFNDKAVGKGSHHAVVPTELSNPAALSGLDADEMTMYQEIVKRYILQFWPAAKVSLTEIVLECGGERYSVKGKRYLDEGWRKAFALDKADAEDEDESADANEEEVQLPEVSVGMVLPLVDCGCDKGTTTAPKRYTQGTLLTAMTNVHSEVKDQRIRDRLREKEGLGTEATRSAIIEETVKHPLFSLGGKKKQEIIPSEDAIRFIQILPDSMTAPDMTALWQIFFDGIKEGRNTYDDFIRQQTAWLRKMVASVGTFFESAKFEGKAGGAQRAEVQMTEIPCNACEAPLKRIKGRYGWFFACSNDACKKMFKDLDGMPVEREEPVKSEHNCPNCNPNSKEQGGFLRRLAKRDKSSYFWGCSDFQKGCKTIFDDDQGKPDFEGKVRAAKSMVDGEVVKCTSCGKGHLTRIARKGVNQGYFWGCSDWRSGCKAIFNDDDGRPDLEGRTRQQGGQGRPGHAAQPFGGLAPKAPAQPAAAPFGSRAPQSFAPARSAAPAPATKPPTDAPRFGNTRPPARNANAGAPAAKAAGKPAPLSFADRARRHGGDVAYDPLADLG